MKLAKFESEHIPYFFKTAHYDILSIHSVSYFSSYFLFSQYVPLYPVEHLQTFPFIHYPFPLQLSLQTGLTSYLF
jgi:hypothetical protein